MKKHLKAGMAAMLLAVTVCFTGCGQQKEQTSSFEPKLDTEKNVELSVTGFFGNFEALDQVTNDFNQYYPNVQFSYEQVGGSEEYLEYLDANPNTDIMMTSEDVLTNFKDKLKDQYVDLSEDIDLSAIEEDMLQRGYHDKKLVSIPMGQNTYGLVVNTTLLEKEGLDVPKNFDEFIKVLTALKEKGYTPIQGPNSKMYAELTQNMVFDMLLSDAALYKDAMAGKESAVEALQPVYDKLQTILDGGFIDSKVNEVYPEDNYDAAILKFFEGDVPFWVCNTEKVSGMKKRESKSEAFQKNPFEYTFMYAPMGEKGAYGYREPWVGFSVNKDANNRDYAVEFLRFLATKDEINKMADIKGIPSIAKEKTDVAIYQNILKSQKVEETCVNTGEITSKMITDWYDATNKFVAGEFANTKEAMKYFIDLDK